MPNPSEAQKRLRHLFSESAREFQAPFRHWQIEGLLTSDMAREVERAEVPTWRAPDGTRGGNRRRFFLTEARSPEFPALTALLEAFRAPGVYRSLGEKVGRDLRGSYLRLEICSDEPGFWLSPHTDIEEKLLSLTAYVRTGDASDRLGTDLYDESLRPVKTIPFRTGTALLFAPARNTWHGLDLKPIRGVRRSVMLNYVTFPTPWKTHQG